MVALGGACVVAPEGGMLGEGGACMARGACVAKGGMHGMHPSLRDTAGHCAYGTHPTGMHSCYFLVLTIYS